MPPPRAIAKKEAADEIIAGVWCALHRRGARPVVVPLSTAPTAASRAVRRAGPGALRRAGAGSPAAGRVPPLPPGLALGARPSQPVWAMDPGTLRAAPIPLAAG